MKRIFVTALAVMVSISLLCTGALAQGGGKAQGGSQAQGSGQPQGGGQAQGSDQSQGGGQMGNGQQPSDNDMQNGQMMGGMPNAQYGRFLDTDKVSAMIAALTDTDAAANLTALLQTYQAAVANQEQSAVQEALQALLSAMNQTQMQTQTQTQTQLQDNSGVQAMAMDGDQCKYLDVDAVAEAIATLTDDAVAATLTGLLETYSQALSAGDQQAIQEAFTALMTALSEAGIA